MTETPPLDADLGQIRSHLEILFHPWRELVPEWERLMVHIAWSDPDNDHKIDRGKCFFLTDEGIDAAASWALARNRDGSNVYVSPNPCAPGTNPNRRVGTADIYGSIWQFLDNDGDEKLDKAQALFADLPFSFAVETGKTPTPRVHAYWRLDEAIVGTTDLTTRWSAQQRGLAASGGGDDMSNPDRVMRLAGGVSYPSTSKHAKGRITERVFMGDAPGHRYGASALAAACSALPTPEERRPAPTSSLNIVNGPTADDELDVVAALIAIPNRDLSWDEWNRVAMATWRATNGSDAGYAAFAAWSAKSHKNDRDETLRKWNQLHRSRPTHIGVGTLFHLAQEHRPGWTKPSVSRSETRAEAAEGQNGQPGARRRFRLLNLAALNARKPPLWLIRGILPRNAAAAIVAPPESFKSFVALDMALCIAYGRPWHGLRVKQGPAVYVAFEGADGIKKRVDAWRKENGVEGVDAPFFLLDDRVKFTDQQEVEWLLADILDECRQPAFVVIDTVARALSEGGADENSAKDVGLLVRAIDRIRGGTGATVAGVHHTGKDVERGARGSSALLGAIDTELTIKRIGERHVDITVTKQKDGAHADPIRLEMHVVDLGTVEVTDDETGEVETVEVSSLVPRSVPITERALPARNVVLIGTALRAINHRIWARAIVSLAARIPHQGDGPVTITKDQLYAELIGRYGQSKKKCEGRWPEVMPAFQAMGIISLSGDAFSLTGVEFKAADEPGRPDKPDGRPDKRPDRRPDTPRLRPDKSAA